MVEKVLAQAQALCTRTDSLLKHGLSAKAALLILLTYSKSCINHLQRANFENGPWVAQLEDTLQDVLGCLVNVPGYQALSCILRKTSLPFFALKMAASPMEVYQCVRPRPSLADGSFCMKHVADILNVSSVAGFKRKCPTVAAQMDAANSAQR